MVRDGTRRYPSEGLTILLMPRFCLNPLTVKVETLHVGLLRVIVFTLGGFNIHLTYFVLDSESATTIPSTVMLRIHPLVPPSVTTLKVDLSEAESGGILEFTARVAGD